jgi:hypothetical protein
MRRRRMKGKSGNRERSNPRVGLRKKRMCNKKILLRRRRVRRGRRKARTARITAKTHTMSSSTRS